MNIFGIYRPQDKIQTSVKLSLFQGSYQLLGVAAPMAPRSTADLLSDSPKSQELDEAAGKDHWQRGKGDPLHRPPEHELVTSTSGWCGHPVVKRTMLIMTH